MRFIGKKSVCFVIALSLLLISTFLYLQYGYSHIIAGIWLLSIILVALHFFKNGSHEQNQIPFNKKDFFVAFLLTAIVSTVYFSVLPDYPHTITRDELDTSIISSIFSQTGFDIFKPSDYHYLPAPVFSAAGYFAQLFGSVDILNVRLASVMLTILCIFFSYFLFRRIFSDTFLASAATILLSFSHLLFLFGHLSMLTNSAIFIQVVASLFLLIGLQRQSLFYIFISGVIAGFGWVVYSPAKIIIISSLVILAALALLQKFKLIGTNTAEKRKSIDFKGAVLVILIGFSMAIYPFMVGALTMSRESIADIRDGYLLSQILLLPEGRESQMKLINTDTEWDGIKHNIHMGLTAFYRDGSLDKGDHFTLTFIDSLTHIFLLIGLLSVLLTVRKLRMEDAVILINFLFLFLVFSFFVSKAPHFYRMMIMLPFIISFAVIGIFNVSKYITTIFGEKNHKLLLKICIAILITTILYLNITMIHALHAHRASRGDKIPNVITYIHDQKKKAPEIFNLTDETGAHDTQVFDIQDWQRVWLSLFLIVPPSFEFNNLTVRNYEFYQYTNNSFPEDDYVLFNEKREPIANTVFHITERIRREPYYFYLINGYQGNHPKEFQNAYDWEIWQNLFSVFRQPLNTLNPRDFLSRSFNLPAVFFVTQEVWNDLYDPKLIDDFSVNVEYLSKERRMVAVEIISKLR